MHTGKPHIIKKQLFDLHVHPPLDAYTVLNRISYLAREELAGVLDGIFSTVTNADETLVIDKLEIDLGVITAGHLEKGQLPGLAEIVKEELTVQYRKASAPGGMWGMPMPSITPGMHSLAVSPCLLERIPYNRELTRYYLEKGTFPWWHKADSVRNFPGVVRHILEEAKDWEAIVPLIASQTARRRFLKQCSQEQLFQLAARRKQGFPAALFWEQLELLYAAPVFPGSRKTKQELLREALLLSLLLLPDPTGETFLLFLVTTLACQESLPLVEFIRLLLKQAAHAQTAIEKRFFLQLQQLTLSGSSGNGVRPETAQPGLPQKAAVVYSETKKLIGYTGSNAEKESCIFPGNAPNAALTSDLCGNTGEGKQPPGFREAEAGTNPSIKKPTIKKPTIKKPAAEKTLLHRQPGDFSLNNSHADYPYRKKAIRHLTPAFRANLPAGAKPHTDAGSPVDKIVSHFQNFRKALPEQGDRSAAWVIHLEKQGLFDRERVKRIFTSGVYPFSRDLPERETEFFIGNSGLVILWPFLKNLWEYTGIYKDGSFTNQENHSKSLLLLQYLATGNTECEEGNWVLNKILCGWPLAEPPVADMDLSEEDKAHCDRLLESVIRHWSILKNTSVPGLRQAFILREGMLTDEEGYWKLRVERKGYDILLDKLPWGLAMFKTSWMEKRMVVEW